MGRTCCFPLLTLGADFGKAESKRKERKAGKIRGDPAWLHHSHPEVRKDR